MTDGFVDICLTHPSRTGEEESTAKAFNDHVYNALIGCEDVHTKGIHPVVDVTAGGD